MFNTKVLTIFVILGCSAVHGYLWCSEKTDKIAFEKCMEEMMEYNPGILMERLPNGSYVVTVEVTAVGMNECMKQYKINLDEFGERIRNRTLTKEEALAEVTPQRYANIIVCAMKKWLENEKTIKEHITDSLNKAETEYTKAEVDELKDTVEKCIIKAKGDEPKLIECLEPWNNYRTDALLKVRRKEKMVVDLQAH